MSSDSEPDPDASAVVNPHSDLPPVVDEPQPTPMEDINNPERPLPFGVYRGESKK